MVAHISALTENFCYQVGLVAVPVITVLRRLRQEDNRFKTHKDYM